MRRPGWHRVLAVVCAMWMVVVLAEPTALHTCAEHEAVSGAGHGNASADGAAYHAAHAHQVPAKRHHGCSCIGACCFAVAPLLHARADALISVETQIGERCAVSHASDFRPSAVEYARPPTIGPPVTTA